MLIPVRRKRDIIYVPEVRPGVVRIKGGFRLVSDSPEYALKLRSFLYMMGAVDSK